MDEEQQQQQEEKGMGKYRRKELGISCMLNTEVGSLLAVIRRPDFASQFISEDYCESVIQQSMRSLRTLIFNTHQEWRTVDPSIYLSPFLDVIRSDDVPAAATGVAILAILKILKLQIFDDKTPGAKEALSLIVSGITTCRLEKTDLASEDAVMMKILQLLIGIMRHKASDLLPDHTVCTIVNSAFQIVQQSVGRGDLLQRCGRYTMHELVMIIFSRLSHIVVDNEEGDSESETEDFDEDSGYGTRCAVDIFQFLCSLLNVMDVAENDGSSWHTADVDVQVFALVLINCAIELSGDEIEKHPQLLRLIQDDLFHHLIHYGTCSSPLLLSMICSTVLNIYHFLRRFVRLQLEAFFTHVLLRVAGGGASFQLKEVALEGIINLLRQPTFIIEAYVNYDCNPIFRNVFEEIAKLLCKQAFPGSAHLTSLQIQAFEGLVIMVHAIAENTDRDDDSSSLDPYPLELTEFRPFWIDQPREDLEAWVEYLRVRKVQKKKIMIARDHFNRDEKKGLEYLKHSKLVSDPPETKALAFFFRYIQGLDKSMVGDYFGDPDEFHLEVLTEFTESFDFRGMYLDSALRTYLETFRLPGESQKIQRVLEVFSERFFEQSSEIFVSKDAVFIFCYSLILLNTDHHNKQVKKKMTEEEFIRNNRAINGGQDLPREYLSELFHSISNNAISLTGQSGPIEMNASRWIELMNRAKSIQPYVLCDFDRRLGRDMFSCVAGATIAALSAFFEHAEDNEMLYECIQVLINVARIARYGMTDTLDELVASFCKFTTLLNPYASAEETLFAFSNDIKPRIAILAAFTIANNFGDSLRAGWRNIIECLLKLRRLKLLSQSVIEFDSTDSPSSDATEGSKSGSGVNDAKSMRCSKSSMIGRFSQFLSVNSMEDSISLGMNEFEQNLKIIKQCRIGSIFENSSNLTNEALNNLGRSLIFASTGKGQKFTTSIEEEETVGFCWDLVVVISISNMYRFQAFWPSFHEYLLTVAQFPMFSPIPFAEKAIIGLFKICLRLLAKYQVDKSLEELIFKSINLMWKLEKEILDSCSEFIIHSVAKIVIECPANLQTQLGWKSVLHLLSVSGRHPETYDQAVESLIMLMSDAFHLSPINYSFCIDCAFGFVALKNSPLDKNLKILDLMSDSVNLLINWYEASYSDPGTNYSNSTNSSISSMDDNSKAMGSVTAHLFLKLGESLRKGSLARREEIRNRAIAALRRSFELAEGLEFSSTVCINCFNQIIFGMVDDLHEKMVEYSKRENAEKEVRSMEGTLTISMELLVDVFLRFVKQIVMYPEFRTFWLGVLRRMDTCMKVDLGEYGESRFQETVPELLRKMIKDMQEKEILEPRDDDDLWEKTYVQIQWIAPSLKDELFPDV